MIRANEQGALQYVYQGGETLAQAEAQMILLALDAHRGNRTHAARALGVSVRTIRSKLPGLVVMGLLSESDLFDRQGRRKK